MGRGAASYEALVAWAETMGTFSREAAFSSGPESIAGMDDTRWGKSCPQRPSERPASHSKNKHNRNTAERLFAS